MIMMNYEIEKANEDVSAHSTITKENILLQSQIYALKLQIAEGAWKRDQNAERISKLLKVLDAYGLNEDSEVDFRKRFGNNGEFVLVSAYIRIEFQQKYDLPIPGDVKAMVFNIYQKLWHEEAPVMRNDEDDDEDQLSLDEDELDLCSDEEDCEFVEHDSKELLLDFESSQSNENNSHGSSAPMEATHSNEELIPTELGWEDPEASLYYEKLKVRDLQQRMKALQANNYIINKTQINTLFGRSISELIPFGLNEKAMGRYKALFDGYVRELYTDSNFAMVPKDINHLISCYYPIFD
eukprot:1093542_1